MRRIIGRQVRSGVPVRAWHRGGKISRVEGGLLLTLYAAYMGWTISQNV